MEGMTLFIGIFIFITGLIFGSFFNVCIYRLPEGKSIATPPSACPACGHRLGFFDLFPVVSWIFLGGKCRYCKARVSPRYLLVELLTGAIWFLVYLRFDLTIEMLAVLFLASILIIVFFIDLDHMIIPDELVIAGLVVGFLLFVYNIFVPVALYSPAKWFTPLIGMVSASGILFVIAIIGLLIYKDDGAMGMGDVKIFLPIGLILGWKTALLSLFCAIILGGVVAAVLMILKIRDRKSAIPFGPFIIIATIACALYGDTIVQWYTRTIIGLA